MPPDVAQLFPALSIDEILRRCDEAEAHPERLLGHEEFFRLLNEDIRAFKQAQKVRQASETQPSGKEEADG
jgi:hypothetical protein